MATSLLGTSLCQMSARQREELGHQYFAVTYVTIEGAGGSTRVWSFELADWLASKPGTLIVRLTRI